MLHSFSRKAARNWSRRDTLCWRQSKTWPCRFMYFGIWKNDSLVRWFTNSWYLPWSIHKFCGMGIRTPTTGKAIYIYRVLIRPSVNWKNPPPWPIYHFQTIFPGFLRIFDSHQVLTLKNLLFIWSVKNLKNCMDNGL